MNGDQARAGLSSAADAMDRMYGWQHAIYDLTRKHYLLGRDCMIDALSPPEGGNVMEIGCGTGRNLIRAARRWPNARFFGYDVSAVMVEHARKAIVRSGLERRIRVTQGDACAIEPRAVFGVSQFERIYMSYVLSMIPAWREALASAVRLLPPEGVLHVVDFGAQVGLISFQRTALNAWLKLFDVQPRAELEEELKRLATIRSLEASCAQLYHGYAVVATLRRRPMSAGA